MGSMDSNGRTPTEATVTCRPCQFDYRNWILGHNGVKYDEEFDEQNVANVEVKCGVSGCSTKLHWMQV